MTLNPLTPPPAAPSRSDVPATFITRADAFINWWSGTFTPEFNALLPEIVLAGSANNYGATSTTSLAIGTGSKSLTVQTDKAFQVGQFVQIANTATPANYMFGQVTAYNASTGAMTVLVSAVGGSGTFTAWTIGLAATGGAYAQLSGATFTGGISAPLISVDATANCEISSGNYYLRADTNDFLFYGRAGNYWRFLIGNVARLDITSTGGRLYGDWTVEGTTYFNNDPGFAMYLSGGNPALVFDTGDYYIYDRANNNLTLYIGNVARHTFDTVQHKVNGDPVVTRASTDTLTNKTLTAPTINSAALNPSGSAPLFPGRAWVNFNGTGTVAIRGSGNVSSITDLGTGRYQVNLATAMPDANYAPIVSTCDDGTIPFAYLSGGAADITTTDFKISTASYNGATSAAADRSVVTAGILR